MKASATESKPPGILRDSLRPPRATILCCQGYEGAQDRRDFGLG